MGSRTYFNCENVQFSATHRGNPLGVDDDWQPAKVYVTEFTDDTREHLLAYVAEHELTMTISGWLFVSTDVEEAAPVVFRVIKEGWDLHCDEVSHR